MATHKLNRVENHLISSQKLLIEISEEIKTMPASADLLLQLKSLHLQLKYTRVYLALLKGVPRNTVVDLFGVSPGKVTTICRTMDKMLLEKR